MNWEKNKRGTILRIVNEMFLREVNNCETLLAISSFKEKAIQENMFKKNSSLEVGRIFLNVDSLVEISFSMIWTLKDLLTVFFKERKERRGEKWELELDEKNLESEERIEDLKELAKRFEIEKDQEFGLLAKEEERKERKEKREEKREEEREEEEGEGEEREKERGGEEEDFQLEVGGLFLEFLPPLVIEYSTFHQTRFPFHESELQKVIRKGIFQSWPKNSRRPGTCFATPNGRIPRDALYANTTLRLTSSQREKILLQCYRGAYDGWGAQFFKFSKNMSRMERIGKNKFAKKIEGFWSCYIPRAEKDKYDSDSEEEDDDCGTLEEEDQEDLWWPYSENVLFSEEWISQNSSVLQSDVKDLIKFVNVLDELRYEALSFENKLTKEGKKLRRFCEIFLDFCPRFTDLVLQWANCYCLLVNSLKKIPFRGFKEELLSLESFFSNIFKPLTRLTTYLSALQILDYWGGVKKMDREILSKTVVCYQQMVHIPADSFGKLRMKGRSIKGAVSPS